MRTSTWLQLGCLVVGVDLTCLGLPDYGQEHWWTDHTFLVAFEDSIIWLCSLIPYTPRLRRSALLK